MFHNGGQFYRVAQTKLLFGIQMKLAFVWGWQARECLPGVSDHQLTLYAPFNQWEWVIIKLYLHDSEHECILSAWLLHVNLCFLRQLNDYYPHFPLENELTNCIERQKNSSQHIEENKYWLLSIIALKWKHLQAGEAILPNLVEFYSWLHTNLSFLMTREQATKMSIHEVIKLAKENSSEESGLHITTLYERVLEDYNEFVKLQEGKIGVGPCGTENKITPISDDTSILFSCPVCMYIY